MDEGYGYIADLVVPEVDHLQDLKRPPAQLPHIRDLIHMQVQLRQLREVLEDSWDLGQMVSVE